MFAPSVLRYKYNYSPWVPNMELDGTTCLVRGWHHGLPNLGVVPSTSPWGRSRECTRQKRLLPSGCHDTSNPERRLGMRQAGSRQSCVPILFNW